MKTQTIRLIDVLLLGPAMVWAGWLVRDRNESLAAFVAGSGFLTSLYNWNNYQRSRGEK